MINFTVNMFGVWTPTGLHEARFPNIFHLLIDGKLEFLADRTKDGLDGKQERSFDFVL